MAYKIDRSVRSPNYTRGRPGRITEITIHHWGVRGQRFSNVVNWLCRKNGTSSSTYVAGAGRISEIVAEANTPWTNSNFAANQRAITIECRPEMTADDLALVAWLIADIRRRRGMLKITKHSDYAQTACPGTWAAKLAWLDKESRRILDGKPRTPAPVTVVKDKATVAVTPSTTTVAKGLSVLQVQRQLKTAGYYKGVLDSKAGPMLKAAVGAYQKNQRFFPGLMVDHEWGRLTQAHFEWVKKLQSALNKWKTAGRVGMVKLDGDYAGFTDRLVRQTINDNFNGAYTTAVRSVYGAKAVPVNDGKPGKAFCKMVGITPHPMDK